MGGSLTISGTDAEHPRIIYMYIFLFYLILIFYIYIYIYNICYKRDGSQGRTTCAPVPRPLGKLPILLPRCFRYSFSHSAKNYLVSSGMRFAHIPLKGIEHQSYAAIRAEARAAGLCGRQQAALAVDRERGYARACAYTDSALCHGAAAVLACRCALR